MKKFLSYILLASLLSLNNLGFVFAGNTDSLQSDKQNSIILLDNLEKKLDSTLESTITKIKSEDLKDQIEEKQKEIEDYINQKQSEIKKEDSKADIKNIIEETTKVVTLKAVAGVTPTQDVTESISSQIEVSKNDLEKAQDTLIDSLKEGNKYTLMLKSKLNKEDILKLLNKFDKNISLHDLFEEDGSSYFELEIGENSLLKKELLENIEDGEVPSNFLGIEVIKPELLKIGDIQTAGEEIDKLWGIKRYNTQKYLDKLLGKTQENGKKLQIGIIDTGISYNHPDLKNQISKSIVGYDFVNDDNDPLDDQGHGTHVSGTIAGDVNGAGVYGVNPYVELVGLKICDSSGFCPTYGVLKALDYAKEKKIDILNMSLGAKGNVSTSPVCQAIKDITQNGTVVVAASGNSNIDTSKFVPGGCSEAITVGAIDENNTRAVFSNYGEKVDVAAAGVGVYSTYLNNGYKSLNGTSMATPHIVGVVSVLKTFKPDLTTKDIKELFKNNAVSVQTESNKKIASAVDLDKILANFGVSSSPLPKVDVVNDEIKTQTGNTNQETKTSDEVKDQKVSLPQNDQTETQTGSESVSTGSEIKQEQKVEMKEKSPEELGLVNIGVVDESIGFTIQNSEEETTKINSVEGEKKEFMSDEPEKQTINLDHENNENINISSGSLKNDSVEINNTDIKEIQEDTGDNEDSEAGIQSSFTCRFDVGGSCSLNLTSANTYTYTASQAGYLSYSASNSKVIIYGNKAGTTTFYIKKGNTLVHTIVITVDNPLLFNIGATSVQNGNNTYLNITNGNGRYTVTSSNTSIAVIGGSNTSWTIYGKGVGSTTITIKDNAKSYSFTMNVTARNLTLNTTNIKIDKNTYGYFNITDGNGGYKPKVSSTNLGIYPNGTNGYRVYSAIPGKYTVQITDSQWKTTSITIDVLYPLEVTNFNQSTTRYVGETINFSIISGNGNYSVSSSNTNVATVSLNYLKTGGVITPLGGGYTKITLTDGVGKSVSIDLSVKQKYDVKLGVIYDVKAISNKGVGGLKFKVSGNSMGLISEIGVQFTNEKGILEKKPLKIQKDGEYIVAFSTNSFKNCKDLKPYYTIGGATNIANASDGGNQEENNYTEEEYVYNGDEENSGVEINSTGDPYMDFLNNIRWIWKYFGYESYYNQTKEKVIDIKDKYGEQGSLLISLIPAVGEGYDILTLLIMKDPITGEKLTKLTVGLTLIGLLSCAGSGSGARKIGEEVITKLTDDFGAGLDEITRIATNYFNGLEFSTVDGLIKNAQYFKKDNFIQAVKKDALNGGVKATSSNYGKMFDAYYGVGPFKMADGKVIKTRHRHHVFPQDFEKDFTTYGINIHDPKYLTPVEGSIHLSFSKGYNEEWKVFFKKASDNKRTSDTVKKEAEIFAKNFAKSYNYLYPYPKQ